MARFKSQRRQRIRPRAEINMTNLVDITMTLLVVFMIVAPLLAQGLQIELPSAQVADNLPAEEKVILVECDRNGLIAINREQVVMGAVSNRIRELLDQYGDFPVQVRADKDLPFGSVVGVWGEIRAAGVENINVELVKISIGD